MPDFPAAVPDVPDMVPANPLATAHGAVSHVTALNRTLANVRAIATKLGTFAGAPTPRKVLAGSAAGSTVWADYAAGATLFVASSTATAAARAVANYVCDGVADEVEIQAALNALPTVGGTVRLSEGTFALAAGFATNRANSHLLGAGMDATILRATNAAGTPVNTTLVAANHLSCSLRDLTIDGNKANNAAQTGMLGVGVNGSDVLVANVRVRNSAGYGMVGSVAAARVRMVGCIAEGCANYGFVARAPDVAGQALLERCIARSNVFGFVCDSGPATLTNCAAVSNTQDGFSLGGTGPDRAFGCDSFGNGGSGFTVGAPFSELVGCRAVQNGVQGIYGIPGGTDALFVGNQAYLNAQFGLVVQGTKSLAVGNRAADNGTLTNNTYGNILVSADDCFIDGNLVRKGTLSANKAAYGIWVNAGANSYLGHNDTYDGGVSGPISDSGTNTRRVAKVQLDYVLATDTLNGAQSAGVYVAMHASQTFRIDSATSIALVSVRGSANIGPTAADMELATRIVVDGAVYTLGGALSALAHVYSNPFVGIASVTVPNLAIGNHLVRTDYIASQAHNAFLRPSAAFNNEHFQLQVVEYQR